MGGKKNRRVGELGCSCRGKVKEKHGRTHPDTSQQPETLVQSEMPLFLWLCCHKGKEAIHPVVCVER